MSSTATNKKQRTSADSQYNPNELCDWDQDTYLKLISTELTSEQRNRILEPEEVHPRQAAVLAVHWHPEFIPMELIQRRIDAMFPNRAHELIIPTQHNVLMEYDGYAGVEVDCYSQGFNRKVQLLLHFEKSRVEKADVLRAMLAHTFKYRSRQLFEYWDSITESNYQDRLQKAAARSGADDTLVEFVKHHTSKLKALFTRNESITPAEAIKNKLIMHYFDTLREHFDDHLINHAQTLLKSIKKIVKAHFSLEFFYQTEEIIEEVRGLNGGIVIPHPEQFWPILLAEYDVDGYEVWNPQSREYTEFLIHAVNRQNKNRKRGQKSILIFMGDDCHMGEKAKEPRYQIPDKVGRQIGVQPAWDDLAIRKSLIVANASRRTVIEEYKTRLSG